MELLQTFLLLVGAFLVAIVLFVALLLFWLRYKFRTILKSFGEAAATSLVPPFRVVLQPIHTDDEAWSGEATDEISAALEEAGFQRAGDFASNELPGFCLRALSNPDRWLDAVIYNHHQLGVWLDLVSRYTDESVFTYTTAAPAGLANPPFLTIEHHPGAEPQELLQHCLATRPQKELLPTPPASFRDRFEEAYAREMDWRANRGGPSDDEIRAIAARSDQQASPEFIAQVREAWRARMTSHLDGQLREAFLDQGGLSARRWEEVRERLVFIHDRLTEPELMATLEPALIAEVEKEISNARDEDDEADGYDDSFEPAFEQWREKFRQAAAGLPPRRAFAKMIELLPPDARCERIGEVDQPLSADVYLRPEDES
jgi:hypothetical protein